MLNHPSTKTTRLPRAQHGISLLEVLVTIAILAIGLLGLAGLQSQVMISEIESFQRAQALTLLNDMADRIATNRTNAATYVQANSIGNNAQDGLTAACGEVGPPPVAPSSPPTSQAGKDICEWRRALQGATEVTGAGSQKRGVGGALNSRGCIQLVQAENATTGVCQPGIYRVTVVWQGMAPGSIPTSTCGAGLYGNENLRRAVSTEVSVGLPTC